MLLFRSEEHVKEWYGAKDMPLGRSMSLEQQWHLARLWYSDRMSPDWRRRTPEEAEAVFAEVGLEGDFWHLSSH